MERLHPTRSRKTRSKATSRPTIDVRRLVLLSEAISVSVLLYGFYDLSKCRITGPTVLRQFTSAKAVKDSDCQGLRLVPQLGSING